MLLYARAIGKLYIIAVIYRLKYLESLMIVRTMILISMMTIYYRRDSRPLICGTLHNVCRALAQRNTAQRLLTFQSQSVGRCI